MTNNIKITVPDVTTRDWKLVEDLPFTAEEIVTIVHRYCDAQDHAKKYRVRVAAKNKLIMARAKELGLDKDVEEELEEE